MKFRAFADNVLIELLPLETQTSSGLHLANPDPPTREAKVLSSGPGHYSRLGVLIPNEVKEGDRVIVSKLCGDKTNWSKFDVGDAPRANEKNAVVEFDGAARGNLRVVRHDEILCVIEREAQAAE